MWRLPKIAILHSNKLLKQVYNTNVFKCIATQANSKNLVHLKDRSLLQIKGDETSQFLQGLITNDMRHFDDGALSIYSLLLNTKGRVLYDIIIYKLQENGIFYVECDTSICKKFLIHLNNYKLRKKVEIKAMADSMKVWAVYNTNVINQNDCDQEQKSKVEGKIFPCRTNDNKFNEVINNIHIYSDPRISELGLRILTQSNIEHNEIIKYLEPDISIDNNTSNYTAFRYKLGIGEGVKDLSFGHSFPQEINCDYLHGVSFHKGCYIGQEVTARTYHTGVVRKRLMPLIFNNVDNIQFNYDEMIVNENEKQVGKIRGHNGTVGLGLIRISEALSSKTLTIRNCVLKIVKPHWWPQESPKIQSVKSAKS